MEFRVLGPLEVVHAGKVLALGGAKQRAVLALLVLHASEPVSLEQVVDELWGERPPSTAPHAVQVYVSGIRKILRSTDSGGQGDVVVRTSPSGYVLEVEPERIDARRFQRLLDEGQDLLADDASGARQFFEAALALWRGVPLAEFELFGVARQEADRLDQLRVVAAEGLVDARLAGGEHAALIGEINRLVAADPLREHPRRQLMLALYRSGRHAEALAAYRDGCEALDEIGLQPGPELRQLEQAILRHDTSLSTPSPVADDRTRAFKTPDDPDGDRRAQARGGSPPAVVRPNNLPADRRPLIGRDAELARVCALLRDSGRLVTLVGIGGVGKTRLAVAAARRLLDDLEGGAYLVSLAAVSDPGRVLPAVAHALGVQDVEGDPLRPVLERLRDRPMLLILDNFEQILAAGQLAGDLVAAAPSLRIIVTSQAPLRIGAETVFGLDALAQADAVELFVERAAASMRDLVVSEAERPVVAEICERVGNVPLALELAAGRVGVLAPADLLRRLAESSELLASAARDAPERHRSLRATVEWTYAALSDEQRVLFRRMGVFAGAVPLGAIEAVAERLSGDDGSLSTLDALQALIDFSLVHRHESPVDGLRFSMPQALRDFAREKLIAAEDLDAISRRHAEHVSDIAENVRFWFDAPARGRADLVALDQEVGPALAWASGHDRDLHRRLVAGVGMMLISQGQVREANEHLTQALEGVSTPADPLDAWLGNVRACGLTFAGHLADARATLEQVIAFDRERGEELELALTLRNAAWVYLELEEFSLAVAVAEESLELVHRAGDQRLLPTVRLYHIQTLISAGRLDDGERLLDQAEPEDGESLPGAVATMRADIALGRGEYAQALDRYATSVVISERLGDTAQIVGDAQRAAWLLSLLGHTEAALETDALVAEIARDAGYGIDGDAGRIWEALAAVRQSAGAAAATAAARAAAVPATERVARILALARAGR